MPHLPPAHHETSKRDSPNETKVKEKQNKTIPDLNSNLATSMTYHNQTKELTTWFLKSEPVKVHADAAEDIAAIETKIKSTEAHNVDITAIREKCLRDFENELIKDLAGLHALYVRNLQNIEDLCSPMLRVSLWSWNTFAGCL
jgi:hypothetical protein